ncbi:polysaccharide biosynthesis/export family protein [Pedobacter sp. Du54]|uniref:polysaccharide biosynthesis/export family protein n=1 Tax=Pedobacter anseongensis TaxID=3133439 RepID=UPI0030A9A25F
MKKINSLGIIVLILFLSGCVSYKNIPYFQDLEGKGTIEEQIENFSLIKIQKDDVVAMTVSSLNMEASAIFNMGNTTSSSSGGGNSTNGFLVDQSGSVQLPLVGSIKIEGLTSIQARNLVQEKLTKFLKEPVVSLRVVNFKVSVLGDVSRPGVYPVQSERASVTDALSLAGDLNVTALRNNILLIREDQGKRQFIRLDLTNRDIFNSPHYYLRNNDVLYIQPGKSKVASSDVAYRNATLVLSALSVISVVIVRLFQ